MIREHGLGGAEVLALAPRHVLVHLDHLPLHVVLAIADDGQGFFGVAGSFEGGVVCLVGQYSSVLDVSLCLPRESAAAYPDYEPNRCWLENAGIRV